MDDVTEISVVGFEGEPLRIGCVHASAGTGEMGALIEVSGQRYRVQHGDILSYDLVKGVLVVNGKPGEPVAHG